MVSPTLPKDGFIAADEALAKVAPDAASHAPDAPPRAPVAETSPDAPISPTFAATLGPPDVSVQIPRDQRSLGKRGTLARIAIAVCLGASAIGGWGLYGGSAREMIATWAAPFGRISAQPWADRTPASRTPDPAPGPAAAPEIKTSAPAPTGLQAAPHPAPMAQPATAAAQETTAASPNHQQLDMMARDLAALRQTVAQLAAGEEQLTREIAKLQDEKPQADNLEADKPQAGKPPTEKAHKRMQARASAPGHVSDAFDPTLTPNAPGAPRTLGSIVVRRAAPQAAPQAVTVSPLSPPR